MNRPLFVSHLNGTSIFDGISRISINILGFPNEFWRQVKQGSEPKILAAIWGQVVCFLVATFICPARHADIGGTF
jgi:hypothetical protein